MANKALATRQKLMIRVEPSQKALKARNPAIPDAKQRLTGSQQKSGSKGQMLHQMLVKKALGSSGGS